LQPEGGVAIVAGGGAGSAAAARKNLAPAKLIRAKSDTVVTLRVVSILTLVLSHREGSLVTVFDRDIEKVLVDLGTADARRVLASRGPQY
jgi:hypothetical protein